MLGLARLGLRHGGFGTDPHDYHNEEHVLELAERRLGQVMDAIGVATLPGDDWLALLLFAACHDLRQRETFDVPGPVGGNEAASIAECFRILAASGFDTVGDREEPERLVDEVAVLVHLAYLTNVGRGAHLESHRALTSTQRLGDRASELHAVAAA